MDAVLAAWGFGPGVVTMTGLDEEAPPRSDWHGAGNESGSGTVTFAEWLVAASATSHGTASDHESVDGHEIPVRDDALRGALTAVVVLVVFIATFVGAIRLGGEDRVGFADRTQPVSIAPPGGDREPAVGGGAVLVTGTAAICGEETVSAVAALDERGRIRSGERAIAAFVAAYYHARSGVLAQRMVAPEAMVADAALLQAQIDSVPPGTAYCAWIEAVSPGWHHLELVEYRPNQPTLVRRQRIATTATEGQVLITAIIDRDGPRR
ncbi:hypothetical protein [Nocardia cyriacigeorgica]|uniref:DUF8176 domain-containing protein n=1 Tax=Nocardia cyriacigeorgica TaxID=135487 RepID=A0A5R8PEL2_9NOCA|nr:hypothetical protein [Nocardia cyriacigeorgica]MBF6095747.1 hypothetical protein [Nocardia cyriacigeorgica]TLF73650.1 hypothetical protein FEK34_26545 [Nocardia cyriacigeorgica]TLG10259.1 hypothetical protein FEK35_13735 [Nocardia cyriacigeorgica]